MVILWENKDAFIGVTYDKNQKAWQMHADCKEWSPSIFKQYKKGLEYSKTKLKDNGIDFVYALCETEKTRKFNEMFGLKTIPNQIAIDEEGIENYITILET